ncbi:hypothetical protein U9M48_034272 [Paspalum notatum var. saurae]|uniref:DNA-directed RNA polymerase n=1 Tax=Paspalum notatum var. saurae TaxID=547442 RepID=A0AAQ3UCE1_PASNO
MLMSSRRRGAAATPQPGHLHPCGQETLRPPAPPNSRRTSQEEQSKGAEVGDGSSAARLLSVVDAEDLVRSGWGRRSAGGGAQCGGSRTVRLDPPSGSREEVGPDTARKFLDHTQWLVNYWLLQNGFSIGIADAIDADTMEKINETIFRAKNDANELIIQEHDRQLEAEPGCSMMESFENKMNWILYRALAAAGDSAEKSLSESNNLKAMVTAGSKGCWMNILQMTACVGQQNVAGKRIPFGFIDRTLPHFTKYDYGPESRGFVENSFLRGLTPQDFLFHAMDGREFISNTVVKTPEARYIQRRLVKAMEDIMVKYDGTVRNSLGDVIQFLWQKPEFDYVFRYELDCENWRPNYMLPEYADDLKTIQEFKNVFEAEARKLEAGRFQLGTEIATNGGTFACEPQTAYLECPKDVQD